MEKQNNNKINLSNIPVWGVVIAVAVIFLMWFTSVYNDFVVLSTKIDTAFANVEVQYQRRADLIPNLVKTTDVESLREKDILVGVTEARTQWLNTQSKSSATINDKMAAMQSFDGALSRLLLTVERYPDIKSTAGFESLKVQIEGTENRIAVSRKDYNASIEPYNIKVQSMPSSLVARLADFEKAEFFKANEEASKAVNVEFKDME